MTRKSTQTLVSTDWLAENLHAQDIRILDGSWHMPAEKRHAKKEFDEAHLPNARFFDIDDISDEKSKLPHTAPPIEKFISKVRGLGVGDGHHVIVYDSSGLFSAARVWWMFRYMGFESVSVLDGGLPKWQAEGRKTTAAKPVIRDRHITVRRRPELIMDVTQVAAASKLGNFQIVDARAPERFQGAVVEPREGLRSGHIPNSKNVFFKTLLNADNTMRSPSELKSIFDDAGIDMQHPIITTCGSGITAAVLSLALEQLGNYDNALYDGSWAEWGMYDDLKIETGQADV